MIQSPLELCRRLRWQTLSVVVACSLALMLPGLIGVVAMASQEASQRWLENYHPVVYLNYDITQESLDALTQEVEGWSSVESVHVRRPADARKDLEARLGTEAIQELGVSASMLPTSLVIKPGQAVIGHIDLVSRVASLDARMEVEAVRIPDSMALRVLSLTGVFLSFSFVLGLLSLFAFVLILGEFLVRLLEYEKDQNDVLTMFGATGTVLRRPTLIRGVAIGAWSGALTSFVLVFTLVMVQGLLHSALGVTSAMLGAWPFALLPLVVGPSVGLALSVGISRPARRPSALVPRLLQSHGV